MSDVSPIFCWKGGVSAGCLTRWLITLFEITHVTIAGGVDMYTRCLLRLATELAVRLAYDKTAPSTINQTLYSMNVNSNVVLWSLVLCPPRMYTAAVDNIGCRLADIVQVLFCTVC